MTNDALKPDLPISHFRLLLWLKIRLITKSYGRNASKIFGAVLAIIIMVPFSILIAYGVYEFANSHPSFGFAIDRDILTLAFLVWIVTPLAGFTLNESYDPTKLFVYPVRYQTIFAANVVGSLLDSSTILLIPILVALLISTTHTIASIVIGAALLLMFMVLTVALGQAITLLFIGFLRSRRFKDIMIVFFPLLMLLRYAFYGQQGKQTDIYRLISLPGWSAAEYFPSGWTAGALSAANNGSWLTVLFYGALLALTTAAIVYLAATILRQLFIGERGTTVVDAKKRISADNRQLPAVSAYATAQGTWSPAIAITQKEFRYFVRDPQYKSLMVRIVYMFVAFGFSISRIATGPSAVGLSASMYSSNHWVILLYPIFVVGLISFASTSLVFNIFGGEGAAVTVLFSFPTNRRYFVIGKNIAHASLMIGMSTIVLVVLSILLHNEATLPMSAFWLMMATAIALSVGNLASIRFPYKLVVRGGRFTAGSASTGAGCLYGLIWLGLEIATFVISIPAAACMVLPGIDPAFRVWYTLSIPLGLIYSAGIYYMSLLIADSWMIGREQDIIAKFTSD